MNRDSRSNLIWFAGIAVLVLLCLLFRRVLFAVELAALELRYLWWVFLILLGGALLASLVGRNKD